MTPMRVVTCMRWSLLIMTTEHNIASRVLALIEKENADDSENGSSAKPGRIVAPSKVEK